MVSVARTQALTLRFQHEGDDISRKGQMATRLRVTRFRRALCRHGLSRVCPQGAGPRGPETGGSLARACCGNGAAYEGAQEDIPGAPFDASSPEIHHRSAEIDSQAPAPNSTARRNPNSYRSAANGSVHTVARRIMQPEAILNRSNLTTLIEALATVRRQILFNSLRRL